jgi:phenylalanyl-tRNA synthetase beta chain
MRVPVSWLRDHVAITVPLAELAERLAVSSCEVDRIEHRGVRDEDGNLGRFVVGRVLEAAKHPNADRLQLCHVDVGTAEPLQIVCGAWNFGAGATVAVAVPGAVLPDGTKLERRKLRDVVSEGMILSERELELGQDHTGIIVLGEEYQPGTPLADVLPLADDVFELEVTGNRPDLLSVYGIAREVAALFELKLLPPPGLDPKPVGDERVDVAIEDFAGCPRYIGRIFRDVRIGPSPLWLRARLHAAGVRSISNVVDVTNYVMLALGNPLHAFDLAKLAGGRIVVRRAQPGEELRTLDGQLRRLDPADLMIADGERSVAVAGIMGGAETEVADTTTDILLEAANFEPIGILKSSERLGLRTEGSNRWEKGVDPHLAGQAAALATQLVVELAGARWTGHADVSAELPPPATIAYRPERADALIGVETPADEQRGLLERLGFSVGKTWEVTVPTWRARDVTREVDVVEEVARAVLDRVPFTLPQRRYMAGRLTQEQRLRRLVEDVLAGAGFSEAYTWSLVAEDPSPGALRLPDPLTSEQAVLRTTLLHGLVEAARHNVDAGNERIALFEVARVYLPQGQGELPEERWRVGGIVAGGFYEAKGAVETLYAALKLETHFQRATDPLLHPGKAAATAAGRLGELHPSLLEGAWGVFELDLTTLFAEVPERILYEDVITYPALRQDIAVAVAEEIEAGELVAAVREAAGPELREARVFDVYRGGQVGAGHKSVAIRLVFRSPERTLADEDAAAARERIVAVLRERFGAELRGS